MNGAFAPGTAICLGRRRAGRYTGGMIRTLSRWLALSALLWLGGAFAFHMAVKMEVQRQVRAHADGHGLLVESLRLDGWFMLDDLRFGTASLSVARESDATPRGLERGFDQAQVRAEGRFWPLRVDLGGYRPPPSALPRR
jgi:hypothetical protein